MTKNNVYCSRCEQVFEAKDEWAGGKANRQKDFGHVSKPDGLMTKTNRPFAFFRRAVKSAAGVGTACILILGSCAILTSCGESSNNTQSTRKLSYKAWKAKRWLDSLPSEQRNAILHGGGSFGDESNALANLPDSDVLEGVIELMEAGQAE